MDLIKVLGACGAGLAFFIVMTWAAHHGAEAETAPQETHVNDEPATRTPPADTPAI